MTILIVLLIFALIGIFVLLVKLGRICSAFDTILIKFINLTQKYFENNNAIVKKANAFFNQKESDFGKLDGSIKTMNGTIQEQTKVMADLSSKLLKLNSDIIKISDRKIYANTTGTEDKRSSNGKRKQEIDGSV